MSKLHLSSGGVLPSHRVPAHLARRFNQICLGVTAEILAPEDLTPLLWGVMAAVLEEPGSGQKQVAQRMGVDVVNFGQMVEVLEEKGLIERKIDPDDRRARKLYVTRGASLRRRLRPAALSAQERLLAPLDRTSGSHFWTCSCASSKQTTPTLVPATVDASRSANPASERWEVAVKILAVSGSMGRSF